MAQLVRETDVREIGVWRVTFLFLDMFVVMIKEPQDSFLRVDCVLESFEMVSKVDTLTDDFHESRDINRTWTAIIRGEMEYR